MSEIKTVWIQTAAPGYKDPGAVEIGHYIIVDGFVQMCQEDGTPKGKKVAINGDDPAKIAGRLTREAWLKRARDRTFNRPLVYPKIELA